MHTRKQEFFSGARNTFPLLIGAFPFGLIYGTLAVTSGLSTGAAIAMSAMVFAGSAQFVAVGLVAADAPVPIIILTTFIVNLRHMLYSATLLPYLKNLPQRWRVPLAFWLTDETFAVTVHRFQTNDSSPYRHWFQLGSSIAMYLNWQLCCRRSNPRRQRLGAGCRHADRIYRDDYTLCQNDSHGDLCIDRRCLFLIDPGFSL